MSARNSLGIAMFLVFVICPPKRATWINASCRLPAMDVAFRLSSMV